MSTTTLIKAVPLLLKKVFKVFKSGPSKIGARQPLKNLNW